MATRTQTYGWILLVVFLLGGVGAPALHFNQHLAEVEGVSSPSETAAVHVVASVDIDCSLCDATQQAPSPSSHDHDAATYVAVAAPHTPQVLVLDLIETTWDRGPPALWRG